MQPGSDPLPEPPAPPGGSSRAGGNRGSDRRPGELASPGEASSGVKRRRPPPPSRGCPAEPRAMRARAAKPPPGGAGAARRPREGAQAPDTPPHSPAEKASPYLGCEAAGTATSRSVPASPQRPRRAGCPPATEQETERSCRRCERQRKARPPPTGGGPGPRRHRPTAAPPASPSRPPPLSRQSGRGCLGQMWVLTASCGASDRARGHTPPGLVGRPGTLRAAARGRLLRRLQGPPVERAPSGSSRAVLSGAVKRPREGYGSIRASTAQALRVAGAVPGYGYSFWGNLMKDGS